MLVTIIIDAVGLLIENVSLEMIRYGEESP